MTVQAILDFWFLTPGDADYGKPRAVWFRSDPLFDALIAERFGASIETALDGGLLGWDAEGPQGVLARIVVLDQFTRNAMRGTPASFSGDMQALAAARGLADSGADLALPPMMRWFAYLPFEHAEDMAMQERSVALFSALAQQHADLDVALGHAREHRAVIARFGRFPRRNAILGRVSTADEIAYLNQSGSDF